MASGAEIKRKNPLALQGVVVNFKKLASREIAVGFPAGECEAYPDGTSVAQVAASHVFGVGVPQRDFMALAKGDIAEKTRPILEKIVEISSNRSGLGDAQKVDRLQNAAGMAAQSAIRQAIVDLDTPPNSPATIAAKGSDNPLIDTGHMKDSVTWVVRERTR